MGPSRWFQLPACLVLFLLLVSSHFSGSSLMASVWKSSDGSLSFRESRTVQRCSIDSAGKPAVLKSSARLSMALQNMVVRLISLFSCLPVWVILIIFELSAGGAANFDQVSVFMLFYTAGGPRGTRPTCCQC